MEFKPQCHLHSNVIKNALKAYVIGPLTWKYQVCAVRFLCVDGVSKEKTFAGKFAGGKSIRNLFFLLHNYTFRRKTWKTRTNNQIRMAATAKTVAEQIFCPGISFSMVFRWPEYG